MISWVESAVEGLKWLLILHSGTQEEYNHKSITVSNFKITRKKTQTLIPTSRNLSNKRMESEKCKEEQE
jgi:hypothetical protein